MKHKKLFAILTLVCFMFTLMPVTAMADEPMNFNDVSPSDWYYTAVKYAYESGLMSGTGENTFAPDATLSRGTLMTVLHRMEGSPVATGEGFKDVAKGEWYADAIVWAKSVGLAAGLTADTFGPNEKLTREQLAVFMWRYAQWKGIDTSVGEDTNILSYNDAFEISDWAYGALQWACGVGLISGVGDGNLAPQGAATRAQLAAIMQRFDENVLKDAKDKKDDKQPTYSGGGSGGTITPGGSETIAVTGLTLNLTETSLTTGSSVTLVATVTPDNATDKTVAWSTSDEAVATVDNAGVVTAVAAGTATITATAGGKTATCTVTVTGTAADVAVTGVTLDKTQASITTGSSVTLVATVTPDNATDKTVAWSTSDEAVATVNNAGVVTAVAAGTATITATAGGKTATCEVIVSEATVAVTGVTLPETASVTSGSSITLTAVVTPENATNKNVTWTSSNESVATVVNGVVTGVTTGSAIITVTTVDGGKTATCEVTVTEIPVAVTGISLNKNEVTVVVNETETLVATVTPSNATYGTIEWTSNDETIVTVDNGTLTGVAVGTATISAKAGEVTTTCAVTVHAHDYGYGYEANENGKHKRVCKCGAKTELEACVYDTTKVVDEYTFEACACGNIGERILVSTAEELSKALTADKQNISVVLLKDIDLPITSLGTITAGSGEYKLGSENTLGITIDLNGKKLNITTSYWSAIGAKNSDATITIKNGSMTSTGNSAKTWNAYDVRLCNCNYVLEEVTFEKSVALDNAGKTTTMNKVIINDTCSSDVYGLWITAEGQNVILNDCTIDTTNATDGRGIKIDEQYVDSPVKVTLTVSDTTFKTEEKSAIIVKSKAGADINLNNINITDVVADKINAVWVDEDSANYADLVTVTGGSKIVEGAITTADALVAAFENLKAGDVIYLGADIDMTGKTITPVTNNKGFTMYGYGYTISNLTSTAEALFVSHSGSSTYVFDGVKLKNCSVNSATNYGALFVGDGDTSDAITINNCHVENCTVTSAKYAAAFVGYTAGYDVQNNGPVYSDVTIKDCSVTGGSITGGGSTGAAIGHAGGNVDTTNTITNLVVNGVAINGEDEEHTGIVVGTAHIGKTIINDAQYSNVTGNYNTAHPLYGRFVPNTTGILEIDGATVVTDATQLTKAVASGATNIWLNDGEYDVADCKGKTLTINGSKNAVIKIMNEGEDGCDYGFDGSNVTFNGVTINTTANTGNYKGYARMNATFNDCDFIGAYTTHGTQSFNKCKFNFNGYLWTWGAEVVNFDGCEFVGDSRAILAHGSASTVINIKDCKFAASEAGYTYGGDNTAVVEIDPTSTNIYTINFTGNNTKTTHYAGWTRVKDGSTGHVITGVTTDSSN